MTSSTSEGATKTSRLPTYTPRAVRNLLHAVLPARRRAELRKRLQRALLGFDVEQRIDALENRMYESREEASDRSRVRWREAAPNAHLTWGIEVPGDAFAAKAAEYGALGPERRVLEVGPGYGRLLQACLRREEPFRSYVGVDLSAENVAHLRQRFARENISFVEGDIEQIDFGEPVDAMISSLTFKHLFPSFERALHNVARQLSAGGIVVFDLYEGNRRYFAEDEVSYVRWYTRHEVESILAATQLELTAFDNVRHVRDWPDSTRLLVVARKPG